MLNPNEGKVSASLAEVRKDVVETLTPVEKEGSDMSIRKKIRRSRGRPRNLSRFRFPEIWETLPRIMEPGEVKRLLSVMENPRDKAMILILLRTGLRIGELLKLKVDDLNLEPQMIFISEGAKNGIDRVVHISDDARDALVMWLEERDSNKECLFYAAGREGFTYGGVRAMFRKYLEKANLSNKKYSLHSLRHTFASDLLNAGMEPESLQLLLGHKCIESTYRYARLTDKTREEEYFRAMSIIEGEED